MERSSHRGLPGVEEAPAAASLHFEERARTFGDFERLAVVFKDFLRDPVCRCGDDRVSKESASTTVHPAGNPITCSHSSQVKYLAAKNGPVGVAALMSSSLGTKRGANVTWRGVPEASPTLHHKRMVSSSARRNI